MKQPETDSAVAMLTPRRKKKPVSAGSATKTRPSSGCVQIGPGVFMYCAAGAPCHEKFENEEDTRRDKRGGSSEWEGHAQVGSLREEAVSETGKVPNGSSEIRLKPTFFLTFSTFSTR